MIFGGIEMFIAGGVTFIMGAILYIYGMEANRKAIDRCKENLKQLDEIKTTREEAIQYMNDGFKAEGRAIAKYKRIAKIEMEGEA